MKSDFNNQGSYKNTELEDMLQW